MISALKSKELRPQLQSITQALMSAKPEHSIPPTTDRKRWTKEELAALGLEDRHSEVHEFLRFYVYPILSPHVLRFN